MKKIIEHGFKQYMETVCPQCSCKFSYEWEDIIKENTYKFDTFCYYTIPQYKIECPECMHIFQVLNWSFTYPKKEPKITWTCNTSNCGKNNMCHNKE